MIDGNNGNHKDRAQEFVAAAVEALQDQELREAISPGVRRITRGLHELENITADIQALMAERVKARLLGLVQLEIRRAFADALGGAQGPLLDSGVKEGVGGRAPEASSQAPTYAVEGSRKPEEGVAEPHEWQYAPPLQVVSPPASPPSLWLVMGTDDTPSPAACMSPANLPLGAGEQGLCQGSLATAVAEEPSPSADDEVYVGSVRLNVEARGCIRQVVHFVDELRQKPQFRLFQLVGNQKEGANILLGLREPVPLKKVLLQMQGVSQVSVPVRRGPAGPEHLLKVRLAESPSPN